MDRLNQWLTLFANFGVLLGIIFVAVEVQQNTTQLEQNALLAQEAARREHSDSFSSFRSHTINDPDVARIWIDGRLGRELSEVDDFRFSEMAYDLFVPAATAHRHALAVNDTQSADQIAFTTSRYLSCIGLRRMWDASFAMATTEAGQRFANAVFDSYESGVPGFCPSSSD